jgi:Kef-type K+ transport system membrane component KefB
MRSRLAVALALGAAFFGALPPAPARAVELGVPDAGGGSAAEGLGGLTSVDRVQFAQSLSQVAGQVSLLAAPSALDAPSARSLEPERIVAFLAREAAQPAQSMETRASRAVLGTLWSAPEFSAQLITALERSGTPEAAQAARDLSGLVREHRAGIDARRAEIMADVPELRRLSVPASAEELFDGEIARSGNNVDAPAAFSSNDSGSRPGSRLLPSSGRAHADAAGLENEVPAAEIPAKKDGFLRRNARFITAYSSVFGLSAGAFKSVTALGHGLVAGAPVEHTSAAHIVGSVALLSPLPLLLLQLGVILGIGRLFSWILSRVGQPSVVGQIIGGLVLGPSLLGALFPTASAAVFPAASLLHLNMISQLGLVAFMFICGQELDLGALKRQSGAAGLISHASIMIPFVLGAALALALFTGFAPVGVPFITFGLFMGIAMSITAFPVLASILHERGMTSTPLGTLAIASAAIDDISGWSLLAVVLAIATGGSMAAVAHVLGLTAVYLAAMFGAVRPLLRTLAERFSERRWYRAASVAAYAAVLALSAFATDKIGIHALFGAFLAGIVIPRGPAGLSEVLAKRIQGISVSVLLPVFFALTGLRTHLGLLTSPSLWGVAALVVAVATAGKLGSSALAARWSGLKWRDSLSIGALMNTRGLMELVVLNIGYERGFLSGPLFAILVLMAVTTTMMTGPLLSLLAGKKPGA